MQMRRLLFLAGLTLGCRPIAEPAPFDVHFVSSSRTGASMRDPAAAYGTASGTIVVLGEMVADSPCLTLTSELRRADTDLVVSVAATEAQTGCGRTTTTYAYSLRVGRVPAGRYRLTVFHSVRTPAVDTGGTVLYAPEVMVP